MLRTFSRELLVSCRALALTMLLAGLFYPATVGLLGQTFFPHQAGGSLIELQGEPVGSALVGQPFTAAGYFRGRPSATLPLPYDAAASSGSNLGPLNPDLLSAVAARAAAFRATGGGGPVPVDLVTASASGLDPHISPASALAQVGRVAQARNMRSEAVRRLVMDTTEPRLFGLFGEPRVNVLMLNLALDASAGTR